MKNSLYLNIRNKAKKNRETGATPKKPTTEMIRQERKIKAKQYAEGSFVGEDELPTYNYANKQGVIGGPRVTDKGTWLPTTPDGTLVVNMPEFEVISTGLNSQPNPYSPTSLNDFLNSDANPVNWFLPTGEQQRQPIDPKTGMPFPQSGLATPVYPETELIGVKKGKEAIDAFKHVDFGDMPIKKSKSEINWSNWNSEIPTNKPLIKEYNTIEKTSKANGTWMKNADGSKFQGTPEQFVQQNSKNFKKAFPKGYLSAYRGSQSFEPTLTKSLRGNEKNNILFGATDLTTAEEYATNGGFNLDHLFRDVGKKPDFFHPDIHKPNIYGDGDGANPGVYEYAINKELPTITAEGSGNHWANVKNDEVLEWLKANNPEQQNYRLTDPRLNPNLVRTDDVASYMVDKQIPVGISKNTTDSYKGSPTNVIMSNSKIARPKSLRYNNGMFDMANPNIYKAVVPAAIGAGALQQSQQQATGGPTNTLEGDLISKVIMNRNRDKDFVKRAYAVGEYPESNMFVQPDANQFGEKNSHLMSWGEDESGQAYMYPEVMNPNNEAIKVPNQYADYISSTGYKKVTGIPHAQGGYYPTQGPPKALFKGYDEGGYMYPGGGYTGPGGPGGLGSIKPTRQDSLMLFNNALEKIKFYKGNPDYERIPLDRNLRRPNTSMGHTNFKDPSLRKTVIEEVKKLSASDKKVKQQRVQETIKAAADANKPLTPLEIARLKRQIGTERFGKVPNTNLTSFGDILLGGSDDIYNPLAPPIYLHPNITPQGSESYESGRFGDMSDIPYYDPLAIAPFDKLTPEQQEKRVEKYGDVGVPKSYLESRKKDKDSTTTDTSVIDRTPVQLDKLESLKLTNLPTQETPLNLNLSNTEYKEPFKPSRVVLREMGNISRYNNNEPYKATHEMYMDDDKQWRPITKAEHEMYSKQYPGSDNPEGWTGKKEHATGGYSNPYNMYHDDPYLQYKVGGKVWQDIGSGAYGVLSGTLNTITGGLTTGIMDMGEDALQKAANKNFDPNNPEDVKAMREIDTVGGAGEIAGSWLGLTVNPANIGSAVAGTGKGANDIVQASTASDSAKQWSQGISGVMQMGHSMNGMGSASSSGSTPGGSAPGSSATAGAAGKGTSSFGDTMTNFSGSKFGKSAKQAMPYVNQAAGMLGGNNGSLLQQGVARQDYLSSPEYLELQRQGNVTVNQGVNFSQGGNITNNSLNLRNTMRNKRFAKGGTFDQFGINFIPESAGLHHESANGGVPIGPDALAEGGEAKLQMADGGQYIVSGEVDGANTQSINGETMTQRLKKKLKPFMMGSLASNPKDKENVRRPFDSYSEPAITQAANAAVQETEAVRMQRGGAVQYAANGGKLTKDIEKIVMEEYSAAYGDKLPNKYKGKVNMPNSYAKGGIHIKESKKGTFTAAATKHGKSVQEFAQQVLAHKENYSPGMVKKANFAHNAAGWKHADGGYVHNQMTQPMLAEGGPSYPKPSITNAQVQKYVDDMNERGMTDPGKQFQTTWQSDLQNRAVDLGKELNSTDLERVKSLYNFRQQNKNPLGFAEGGPIYGDPASDYVYARGGMYGDPYARGGQIDYTNDMYSSYAGGGPMVSNVNQPFKGPSAQNRGGMLMNYADGGMMPPEQQMMQEQQQAPQEQMQQQGGQEQMMQMVQQVAQAIMQGENPEQIMAELANSGMPQEQVQQVMQAAMQMADQQQQQQPMQGQEQMQPQQGMMARGGRMRYDGGGTFGPITEAEAIANGYQPSFQDEIDYTQIPNFNTPTTLENLASLKLPTYSTDNLQLPNNKLQDMPVYYNNPLTREDSNWTTYTGAGAGTPKTIYAPENPVQYKTVGENNFNLTDPFANQNTKEINLPNSNSFTQGTIPTDIQNILSNNNSVNNNVNKNTDTPWTEEPWYSKAARYAQIIPGAAAVITGLINKKRHLTPDKMAAQTVNYEPERIIDREESRRALDSGLRTMRGSAPNARMLAGNTTNAILNANKGLAGRISESVMREKNTNAQLAQQAAGANFEAGNQFKQLNEGMFQNAQTQALAGLQDTFGSKLPGAAQEERKQYLQEWIARNRLKTRNYNIANSGEDLYSNNTDGYLYDSKGNRVS